MFLWEFNKSNKQSTVIDINAKNSYIIYRWKWVARNLNKSNKQSTVIDINAKNSYIIYRWKWVARNLWLCIHKISYIHLRLAQAQAELDVVMTTLKEKQDQLAEVEGKIAELQKQYDDSVSEKQKLERNIATTAARLKRAAKLTTALGDEQIRWDENVKVSWW